MASARLCPNPDCPYQRRYRRPAEYRAGFSTCSDCGAALVEAASLPAVSAAVAVAGTGARPLSVELLARLSFTLGTVLLLVVLSGLPYPGLGALEEVLGTPPGPPVMGLLSLGLNPFLSAFLLVELAALAVPGLRPLRTGGPEGRATLRRGTLALGLVFAAVQAMGLAGWTTSVVDNVLGVLSGRPWTLSWPAVFLLTLACPLGLHALAGLVERRGVGNGYAVVLLGLGGGTALQEVAPLWRLLAERGTLGQALLVLGLLAGGTVWLLRRHAPAAEGPGPRALPVPTSGLVPVTLAYALVGLPQSLEDAGLLPWPVTEWLQADLVRWNVITVVVAVNLAIALAVLFNRPSRIGAVWAAYGAGDAEARAVRGVQAASRARELLPQAGAVSVLAVAVVAPAASVLSSALGVDLPLGVGFFLAVATVLDLRAEVEARRAHVLVPVWPLHRVYEVEPALAALQAEGISAFARGVHLRSLLHVWGAHVAMDVMVPVEHAERARAVLDGVHGTAQSPVSARS